jgi:hypothetical protein
VVLQFELARENMSIELHAAASSNNLSYVLLVPYLIIELETPSVQEVQAVAGCCGRSSTASCSHNLAEVIDYTSKTFLGDLAWRLEFLHQQHHLLLCCEPAAWRQAKSDKVRSKP